MGFTDTVKKMLGKGKNKNKKPDKSNFYLENDKKRPPRDTYDMSGIEDIGEMPPRNPNRSQNERDIPDRFRQEESKQPLSRHDQNTKFDQKKRPNFPKRNSMKSTRGGDLPQMPGSEPKRGNLPDIGRNSRENSNNSVGSMDRDDIDRIMDRLDDIENRLRSIERRVRRR
ncbi:MAG: hypothetical protein ABEK17_02355 [Candidatus Aenigmatarchaeota archaeon]